MNFEFISESTIYFYPNLSRNMQFLVCDPLAFEEWNISLYWQNQQSELEDGREHMMSISL